MSDEASSKLHWLSLLTAITIMIIGSIYPILLTNSDGKVNHLIVTLYFLSMSAGFVHGVGFVPRFFLWKLLFSGWTCFISLALAVALR